MLTLTKESASKRESHLYKVVTDMEANTKIGRDYICPDSYIDKVIL